MIAKNYSVFCDECTRTEQLFGSSVKECNDEVSNKGWTIAKDKKHTYCPECSLKQAIQQANPEQE